MPNQVTVAIFTPDDLDRGGCREDNSVVLGAFGEATDEKTLAVLTSKYISDKDYEEFRVNPDEEDEIESRYRDGDDDEWEEWEVYGYVVYKVADILD